MCADRRDVYVKTCGLRSVSNVEAAIEARVDAIGFMLAPSKRQVTLAAAVSIRKALVDDGRALPSTVAVVVNPEDDDIDSIARSNAFSTIQLSGDERRDIVARIPTSLAIWKALRPHPDSSLDDVLQTVADWLDGPNPVERVLLDTFHPGAYGGSGVVGNWDVASAVAARYPILLAGGLHPNNVAEAIAQVRPFGVDVSSGIETDGVKDPAKIAAFVQAAHQASSLTPTSS